MRPKRFLLEVIAEVYTALCYNLKPREIFDHRREAPMIKNLSIIPQSINKL